MANALPLFDLPGTLLYSLGEVLPLYGNTHTTTTTTSRQTTLFRRDARNIIRSNHQRNNYMEVDLRGKSGFTPPTDQFAPLMKYEATISIKLIWIEGETDLNRGCNWSFFFKIKIHLYFFISLWSHHRIVFKKFYDSGLKSSDQPIFTMFSVIEFMQQTC